MPGSESVHSDVIFAAALIQARGRELEEPGPPHEDGRYWCLFEVDVEDGVTAINFSSRRNWNRDAWVTATEVLQEVGTLLGGEIRDY